MEQAKVGHAALHLIYTLHYLYSLATLSGVVGGVVFQHIATAQTAAVERQLTLYSQLAGRL